MTTPGPDDDRLIHTVPEICTTGPWTTRRVAQELFLAEALGRPIGIAAARAIVTDLIDELDIPQPVAEVGREQREHVALWSFREDGEVGDPHVLSDAFARRPDLVGSPMEFAARLLALDAFLDAVPSTPHAWVESLGRPGGWVSLAGTDGDLADRLGTSPRDMDRFEHRVLGLAGFGGLGMAQVRDHWVGRTYRIARLTGHVEDFDQEAAMDDPRAVDVWACRALADGLHAHGPAYGCYVRSDRLMLTGSFTDSYRGPVHDVAAFCFGIGMRDGWWLDLEAVVTRHGLAGVADLDTERMWDLYADAGWLIDADDDGNLHLFAPPGHLGPPPSVAEVQAELAARARAVRLADDESDGDRDRDEDDDRDIDPPF